MENVSNYSRPDYIKFMEDVEKLKMQFPVATISKNTGHSPGNVSKILHGKLAPSKNFLEKFYKAFHNELNLITEDPKIPYKKSVDNANEKPFITNGDKPATLAQISAMFWEMLAKMHNLENTMSVGFHENLEVNQVNNSLLQSSLLQLARVQSHYQKLMSPEQVFEQSLAEAKKLLAVTYGSSGK